MPAAYRPCDRDHLCRIHACVVVRRRRSGMVVDIGEDRECRRDDGSGIRGIYRRACRLFRDIIRRRRHSLSMILCV